MSESMRIAKGSDDADRSTQLEIGNYCFRRARTTAEIDAVHRLNYQTFVREIGQHANDGTGTLIDKFHEKSVYFIAYLGEQLVGMVSVHDRPPFSTTGRLEDPAILEDLDGRFLEARLLTVEASARHRLIFAGLIWMVYVHARSIGCTHLLISGLRERQKLYERLGFRPLGDAVRSGQAYFTPMVCPLDDLPTIARKRLEKWIRRLDRLGYDR